MELFNTIKNKSLPSDFSTNYDSYIQNPLIWLLPLDMENKISSSSNFNALSILTFINSLMTLSYEKDKEDKYILSFKLNKKDIFNNKKNNNVIDYFENLLFHKCDDKITIDIIYEKYDIYYCSYDNTVKKKKLISGGIETLIQVIMMNVLNKKNMENCDNYFQNVLNDLCSEINFSSFSDLINGNKKLPKCEKKFMKYLSKTITKKINKNTKLEIPDIVLEAIENNNIKGIVNHFKSSNFNVGLMKNKYKMLNHVINIPNIRCKMINGMVKEDITDISNLVSDIEVDNVDLSIEDINKMENKNKIIDDLCIISMIENFEKTK